MRFTYSPAADALYVELRPDGPATRTEKVGPGINADFDAQGRLLGLEVLDASAHVPAEDLARAESPTVWLTLAEAAAEAAKQGEPIAPATLRSQVAKGKLTAEKRGRDLYVALHELLNYLERRAPSGRRAAGRVVDDPVDLGAVVKIHENVPANPPLEQLGNDRGKRPRGRVTYVKRTGTKGAKAIDRLGSLRRALRKARANAKAAKLAKRRKALARKRHAGH